MARETPQLRLSELLASLSLATDLGTGQSMGQAIRTCLLAVPVAAELGCDDDQIRCVYQVALLRFLGCTAEASDLARSVGGDELAFNARMGPVMFGGPAENIKAMLEVVGAGQPPLRKARLLAGLVTDWDGDERLLGAHCEVASMLARRLGLDDTVVGALAHAYERWDGKGVPNGLAGDTISLEMRICAVARDIDLAHQAGEDPIPMLQARRGRAYDPRVVDVFETMADSPVEADWDRLLDLEPDPVSYVGDAEGVLEVMADFVDLKSRWTRGHSRRVAELAADAAREAGMGPDQVGELRRAGLVHDLGRVGVENGIWDKAGPLSMVESEKMRLHPYLTQRVLSRCEALRPLGALASRHHERADGSGYHRQLDGGQLTPADRILAAADVLAALTADRPHRARLDLGEAGALMGEEAGEGRLDADAVACVVSAAGGEMERPARANPDRLTDREIEVLGLISRELTNKQMADELYISPKTVGRHVENIYTKIGVSTRAGAAVYAMEHHLA